MSVLEYGTYLEDNTTIVDYNAMLQRDSELQVDLEEYVATLMYLRNSGCTITPLAYIPKPGIMWLYRPPIITSPTYDEILNKVIPGDPRVLIQIISSLRNMYYADCDFTITGGYSPIMRLIQFMITTKENIAITTHMRDLGKGKRKHMLGDVTVLNVPYCMMASREFKQIIISRHRDTYLCLKLIPLILTVRYNMVIELGGRIINPDVYTDIELYLEIMNVELPIFDPGFTLDDYLEFADRVLIEALRPVRQLESYDGVYRDLPKDLIVASQSSIIVF